MTGDRLSDIDLLSIERLQDEKIDLDDFLDEFASEHGNRRIKFH